jgi:hypothetical protein
VTERDIPTPPPIGTVEIETPGQDRAGARMPAEDERTERPPAAATGEPDRSVASEPIAPTKHAAQERSEERSAAEKPAPQAFDEAAPEASLKSERQFAAAPGEGAKQAPKVLAQPQAPSASREEAPIALGSKRMRVDSLPASGRAQGVPFTTLNTVRATPPTSPSPVESLLARDARLWPRREAPEERPRLAALATDLLGHRQDPRARDRAREYLAFLASTSADSAETAHWQALLRSVEER